MSSGRVRWTYHVTMRLHQRGLTARMLADAISTLEVVEAYPQDKYLPSFLIRGESDEVVFHAQIATDVEGKNIRVVTIYVPDPNEWEEGFVSGGRSDEMPNLRRLLGAANHGLAI
jgi:hypothetical protein